jgi:hypothetical protein
MSPEDESLSPYLNSLSPVSNELSPANIQDLSTNSINSEDTGYTGDKSDNAMERKMMFLIIVEVIAASTMHVSIVQNRQTNG